MLSCGEYRYKMDIYLRELLQETSSQIEFYQEISQGLVSALLVLVMRLIRINPEDEAALSQECQKIKEYLDQFYNKLRAGVMSTTTQVNSEEFIAVFTPILEAGDDILYIAFFLGPQRHLPERPPGEKRAGAEIPRPADRGVRLPVRLHGGGAVGVPRRHAEIGRRLSG